MAPGATYWVSIRIFPLGTTAVEKSLVTGESTKTVNGVPVRESVFWSLINDQADRKPRLSQAVRYTWPRGNAL